MSLLKFRTFLSNLEVTSWSSVEKVEIWFGLLIELGWQFLLEIKLIKSSDFWSELQNLSFLGKLRILISLTFWRMFLLLIEIRGKLTWLGIASKMVRKKGLVLRSKIMSFSSSFRIKKTQRILAIFESISKSSFLNKLSGQSSSMIKSKPENKTLVLT